MCSSQRVLNSNTIAYVSAAADFNTQRLPDYYIVYILKYQYSIQYKTPPIARWGFAMQLFEQK